MAEKTGRRIICDALRDPMVAAGWRPRALGYFTIEINEDWSGMFTVMTAVEGMPKGHAVASADVSIRNARIESASAAVLGREAPRDDYRKWTFKTNLSLLTPRPRSVSRLVNAELAAEVAQALCFEASRYGMPWMVENASGSVALERTRGTTGFGVRDSLTRYILLAHEYGDTPELATRFERAKHLIEQRPADWYRHELADILDRLRAVCPIAS